ncbi:MAG: MotA/TolQ/ExbB proton channel family protein [Prochlorotrichaceae cyanobacterium]|jgi:biopolymer transport protein ExbB
MILYDQFLKGGPVMWPILLLSVGTVACGLERALFWIILLRQEQEVVPQVLEAAQHSLKDAATIAADSKQTPIGRFLFAPLKLHQPDPEAFRLALESAADREFVEMHKGDKFLETVVALAPLLGLLGTVTGLINTFSNLVVGGGATSEQATQAAGGIGEALLTTAAGMMVAILALIVFRVLVVLQSRQMDYFLEVGSQLELIYRQYWQQTHLSQNGFSQEPQEYLEEGRDALEAEPHHAI